MGTSEEFGAFVASSWTRLVRSAVLLGCQPAEAEDVVQAALTRCFVHWSKVADAEDRDAYVHRVLLNTFTSARRRRWTGEVPADVVPEPGLADDTEAVDWADAVTRSLARLSEDQRAVVVLRFYAHLSERQMAAVLEVAPGTIKSRLSRALQNLAADPQLAELRGAP